MYCKWDDSVVDVTGHDTPVGRPRDAAIDAAVLAAARRHLSAAGYDAMSVAAVAEEAGTTRQAVYRRWPTKADLATAAIASMSAASDRPDTDDPFADLVGELRAFQVGVLRPNGVSMVGSMLQEAADDHLGELYRARIVQPRRARLRHILQRAVDSGRACADADLDIAVAACTGVLYALRLAGEPIGDDWAQRTARTVWRAVGGDVPG